MPVAWRQTLRLRGCLEDSPSLRTICKRPEAVPDGPLPATPRRARSIRRRDNRVGRPNHDVAPRTTCAMPPSHQLAGYYTSRVLAGCSVMAVHGPLRMGTLTRQESRPTI